MGMALRDGGGKEESCTGSSEKMRLRKWKKTVPERYASQSESQKRGRKKQAPLGKPHKKRGGKHGEKS